MGSFPSYPKPGALTDIDLTPIDPQFKQDFAGIMGNAGTDQDGFLQIVAAPAQFIADFPSFLTGVDTDIGDIGNAGADLNTDWHADAATSLAGFISQGDPDFAQYSVDLTGNSPPQPTGGGGGGGGQGQVVPITKATGPFLTCGVRQGMGGNSCGGYPCFVQWHFSNNSQNTINVKSVTLVQAAGGPFTATSTITSQLPPNTHGDIRLIIQGPIPATASAQIQIVTDDPASPHVACVDGGTGSTGGGGSGGGGPIFNQTP